MRPFKYTLGIHTGAATAAIAALQAGTSGVPLTLVGVTGGVNDPFVQDVSRTVTITSAGNESGNRFSIRGIGTKGNEVYDSVVGANIGLAESVMVFSKIISITPEFDTAANVSAGQSATVPSPWIPLDSFADDSPVAVSLFAPVGVLGLNASVVLGLDQLGYSDQKHSNHHGSVFDIVHPAIEQLDPVTAIALAAAGDVAENLLPSPATALRLVNVGPITVGSVTMRVVQGTRSVRAT